MKNSIIKILGICMIAVLATAGCQKKESAAESKPVEETTKKEAEEPVVIDSLNYISVEEDIEIELPDDTWKCTEDTGSSITFESEAGIISIMHLKGEDIASIQVPADQAAYEAMIKGNFAELQYEILEYENIEDNGRTGYKVVVKYDDSNPDKYTVGYGTYSADDGYTVAATLTDDDEELLNRVKDSIHGMKILK